jgi:DNA-binding response OmpR family regulator
MARILVVDDDPDILKMAENVLCAVGHIVFTAEDAMRAMDWLNHIDFDLMLSDANMPLYSGFELVNTIRRDDKYKNLSIAMLTGLRDRSDVARAVEAGVDDYIVKPLDPMILIQKVTTLFEKKPPTAYPEIDLVGTPWSRASTVCEVIVENLSELGCRITSKGVHLKVGMVIDVQCNFFRELDTAAPQMKVQAVEYDKGNECYRAHMIFLGAQEAFLQKIRRWIYTHGSKRPVA